MRKLQIRCAALIAVLLLGAAFASAPRANSSVAGRWEGKVENPPLEFSLLFREGGGRLEGRLTMPANGIEDLALEEIDFDGSRLKFIVPNQDQPIHCEANRQEDGSFSGTYKLGDQDGTFSMHRVEG